MPVQTHRAETFLIRHRVTEVEPRALELRDLRLDLRVAFLAGYARRLENVDHLTEDFAIAADVAELAREALAGDLKIVRAPLLVRAVLGIRAQPRLEPEAS